MAPADLRKPSFPPLDTANWASWVGDARSFLQVHGVWTLVKGVRVRPDPSESKELREWLEDEQSAAGLIFQNLSSSMRAAVKGMEEDPVVMWRKLESIHVLKRPATRFNAYQNLLTITKRPDESLADVVLRVEHALIEVQDLRSSAYDIAQLDDDLATMALIHALPDADQGFVSSLILLPQLDRATVTEAFRAEDTQRRSRESSAAALAFSAASVHVATPPASAKPHCEFCNMDGHVQTTCFQFQRMQAEARRIVAERKGTRRGGRAANAASTEASSTSSSICPAPPSLPTPLWSSQAPQVSSPPPHRPPRLTGTPIQGQLRI